MKRYSGREFSPADLQAITRTIELNPTLKRTPLSRLVCEQLNWRRPDGRLREMSCRVAMLRMQADGLITLPASQIPKPRRRAQFIATPATDEQPVLAAAVHELPALSLHIVDGRVDRIDKHVQTGQYRVLDYKTSESAMPRVASINLSSVSP